MNKDTVVVYHDKCKDGMASRYVAWKHLGDRADYIAGRYEDERPSFKDKRVYLVDFSYKRPVVEEILRECLSLTILDHHKTAYEDLKGLEHPNLLNFTVNDKTKAGVTVCWDYFTSFNPSSYGSLGVSVDNDGLHNKMPMILQHVADYDTWQWRLQGTKQINYYLDSLEFDFDKWVEVIEGGNSSYNNALIAGRAIDNYLNIVRKDVLSTSKMIELEVKTTTSKGDFKIPTTMTYNVPSLINCPKTLVSELLHELNQGFPFSANYTETEDGYLISLRSDSKYGIDVGEIAKSFGGGGHKNASGFFIKKEDISLFEG